MFRHSSQAAASCRRCVAESTCSFVRFSAALRSAPLKSAALKSVWLRSAFLRSASCTSASLNSAGTALLENGQPIAPGVLDRLGVLQTARPAYSYPRHPGPALHDLTVRQVWGWLFAPDLMQAELASQSFVSHSRRPPRSDRCRATRRTSALCAGSSSPAATPRTYRPDTTVAWATGLDSRPVR